MKERSSFLSRFRALVALAFGVFALAQGFAASPAGRPNILFLFADDQRADTIGAWGNPNIKTPNLDRLVNDGFSFRANYIFGGNSGAVCMPSRAMLMSGKQWMKINTKTLKGEKLMPELLGEKGYVTFATGKWHNGEESWLRAFKQGKNIMFQGMSDHLKVPVRDLGADGKLTPIRTGEKFSSELFADSVIEFLKKQDGKEPFFAYVAFSAPHDPRMPPAAQLDYYNVHKPPLPPNFAPQFPFDNGHMLNCRDENLAPWPRLPKMIRDQLAEYYGLISHLDGQIGRILETLKAAGKDKDTYIVYAADNGLALGSHGLMGKQSVFEHSMRVPLIVCGPGVPKAKSTQAFTYLLDVFPTVCDVTGTSAPEGMDGQSLRPLWEGKAQSLRDSVFLPYIGIQRAVRDERWKLIAYPKAGVLQLFDLKQDPYETNNLIEVPAHRGETQRLLTLMKQWQQQSGDTLEVPTENKPYQAIDITGRERVADEFQPDWILKKYFSGSPKRAKVE